MGFIHIVGFENEAAKAYLDNLLSFKELRKTLDDRINSKPVLEEGVQIGAY